MAFFKQISMALIVLFLIPLCGSAQTFTSGSHDFLRARLAAEDGDLPAALRILDRLIAGDPQNPVLLFERASVLLDSGQLSRGELELRKLVARYPDFYDAQRLLARVLLDRSEGEREKVREALVHLEHVLRLNPDDLASALNVSQILVGLGDLAKAERVIGALAERMPDNRIVNIQYAQILTKLGRAEDSRPYLERVVAADPTYAPAVLQLTDLYQKAGEWKKAADLLEPMVADDPMNTDLQRQQAILYLRAGLPQEAKKRFETLVRSDPDDFRSRYFLADAMSDLGQHREADVIYIKLLKERPDEPDVLISYGLNQIARKDFKSADTTFGRLLTLKDAPPAVQRVARTQLASIDYQTGNYARALERATSAIPGEQLNVQAVNIALDVLRREKRHQAAVDLLEPLLKEHGDQAFITGHYVEFLLRTGQTQKAKNVAGIEIRAGKRRGLSVAEAYAQLGQHAEASALLDVMRKDQPEDPDILFQIGSVYERAGKFGAAEKAFLSLLEKNPQHAPTLNYLGYMWADKGLNLDRAAEMLKRAVSQEPRNGAFVDSLGWVYFRLGQYDLAEKHLSDALELLPRDPTVHEHLGDLLVKRGRVAQALERYRKALSLQVEPLEEAKLRSKIDQIEKHPSQ